MSAKSSRSKQKTKNGEQSVVALVHKDVTKQLSETDLSNGKAEQEDSSISNKTYVKESRSGTPSRNASIEDEVQINDKIESGIIGLVEGELRKEKSKNFAESRPQSLSFYDDGVRDVELEGQLEQLSPEEKRNRRKNAELQNGIDAAEADADDKQVGHKPKSKHRSRPKKKKKEHQTEDFSLGNSREQMVPSESQRDSKRYRSQSHPPRRHRYEYDDDDFDQTPPHNRRRPHATNGNHRRYVQNARGDFHTSRRVAESPPEKENDRLWKILQSSPIGVAIGFQKFYIHFSIFSQGLLAGMCMAHYVFLASFIQSPDYFKYYSKHSLMFDSAFYVLCVLCLISVFDRYDFSHINCDHIEDIIEYRKRAIVIVIYFVCLVCHLLNGRFESSINLINYNDKHSISADDADTWKTRSALRGVFAILGWALISCGPVEDLFLLHLKGMKKYLAENN